MDPPETGQRSRMRFPHLSQFIQPAFRTLLLSQGVNLLSRRLSVKNLFLQLFGTLYFNFSNYTMFVKNILS